MYHVVGLGNPGEQYVGTRHNIGRDALLSFEVDWKKEAPANAQVSETMLAGHAVRFVLPETFMNESGKTVRYLVEKTGVTPAELIVVYDDVDLAFGEIKLSVGRGDGGHNGIKSIIAAINSKEFVRVRVGVAARSFWTGKARRPAGAALARHVLGRFSSSEKKQLPEIQATISAAIAMIVTDGVERAMNHYN